MTTRIERDVETLKQLNERYASLRNFQIQTILGYRAGTLDLYEVLSRIDEIYYTQKRIIDRSKAIIDQNF